MGLGGAGRWASAAAPFALGRRCHLPSAPTDFAARGRARCGASADPVCGAAGTAGALEFVHRARFAALSTYSLIALVAMALWRAQWKIRYETWHALHIVLALTAVAAGLAHMVGWSVYLESPWKRTLWIGLTVFWIGLLFYVRIVKPLFQLRRPYRVSELRQERGDSLTLAIMPDGMRAFASGRVSSAGSRSGAVRFRSPAIPSRFPPASRPRTDRWK